MQAGGLVARACCFRIRRIRNPHLQPGTGIDCSPSQSLRYCSRTCSLSLSFGFDRTRSTTIFSVSHHKGRAGQVLYGTQKQAEGQRREAQHRLRKEEAWASRRSRKINCAQQPCNGSRSRLLAAGLPTTRPKSSACLPAHRPIGGFTRSRGGAHTPLAEQEAEEEPEKEAEEEAEKAEEAKRR